MEIEHRSGDTGTATALERARAFSQALSDAARRARFSQRSRRSFSGGGFQARKGQTVQQIAIKVSFWLMVALPSVLTAGYYWLFAANQYVAEARFTIAGGEPPLADGLQLTTGIPAIAIIQDTQIVVNYINSRAAVEKLDQMVGLRKLYSEDKADFLTRFDPSKPIERFVEYWKSMAEENIKLPSGIVEMRVRAFSPRDAADIANAVIRICEDLINDIDDRMRRDAVASAELELSRATARLTQARLSLEKARNDEGLLDAEKAGEAIGKLIEDASGFYLRLQQEYNSQLKAVSADAPQMRALKQRLGAVQDQIKDLQGKLTLTGKSAGGEATISTTMSKFAELDLEKKIAEGLYASAATSLESARIAAEHKMMYINPFVRPSVPEESRYPRRAISWFLITGSLALFWAICVGLGVAIRNHMA